MLNTWVLFVDMGSSLAAFAYTTEDGSSNYITEDGLDTYVIESA